MMSAAPDYAELEARVRTLAIELEKSRKSEERLSRSEKKLRSILDSIEEEYYEVDLEGAYTFVNSSVCRNHGYRRDQLIGLGYRNWTTPQEADRLKKIFSEVYRTGRPARLITYEEIRSDGTVVILEDTVSLSKNEAGEPIGFYGIARNVTEKIKTERALRQSEESYRSLLEAAPDAIAINRLKDGLYLEVNRAFTLETGYRVDEAVGRTVFDLNLYVDPEDRERLLTPINEQGRVAGLEMRYRNKQGNINYYLVSARTLHFKGEDCVLVIAANINDIKQTQQALEASEEKYRTILENMEDVYVEVDLAGNMTFFNPAMCRSYGRSSEELMGLNYREYTSKEGANRLFAVFNEVFVSGKPTPLFEFEIIHPEGPVRMLEGSVSLLKNGAGEPVGFHGLMRDRTEQKKSEKALQESEEKYRLLVQNANDGIGILQDDVVRFSNPKMVELTGYDSGSLSQKPFVDRVIPEDQPGFLEHQEKIRHGRESALYSFRMRNRNNEILWIELNGLPIVWEGRPASLNFLRDITPQKKMEAQFLQAQKLEAIGTLAGGIAHDFNNLLMGVQGNASLSLMEVRSDHPVYERLKSIEQLVQTGAKLTRQLLATARGGKYEVQPTNLNALLEAGTDLFGRTHKEIVIQKVLQEDLWTVEVDRSQIEQVLLNLYVNAGHAMPGGGTLYLETQNVILDEGYARPYRVVPGPYARISVTDSGIGMDESVRKRVFDPFFTTKEMGRGTGLGLASAYGIIQNHNGIINVYSEKGKGTTFTLYLPISQKTILEERQLKKEILKGNETVLLVDDEAEILEIGKKLMEGLGYRVITAGGGQEAIDLYQQRTREIDLVMLDMIMPGVSGGEAYDRMRVINPSIKVLLCSGYSLNGEAKAILDRGCQGFIQKPFTLAEISKRVRHILTSFAPEGID